MDKLMISMDSMDIIMMFIGSMDIIMISIDSMDFDGQPWIIAIVELQDRLLHPRIPIHQT